jgi:GDP/UDP-N,N'-diacetylbacillosamine 2-epimerase (hydrolysing)
LSLFPLETRNESENSIDSFASIHQATSTHIQKHTYDFAFVMGDRPESFAFASSIFLHQIPLIHYAGGDITDNAYLDSTIRHLITKMAHLHFTLSCDASKVIEQLAEESWRIHTVGISTYDYDRLQLLPSSQELHREFDFIDFSKEIFIFTYHATHYKTPHQNYLDFLMVLECVASCSIQTILTYPNNDSGSQEIIEYLQNHTLPSHIHIVKNIGTKKLMAFYKYAKTIVVGNSSSGVLETPKYATPTLNIGERQGNRKRAANVFDVALHKAQIKERLLFLVQNYQHIVQKAKKDTTLFGKGESAKILKETLLDATLTPQKLLFKKFVRL